MADQTILLERNGDAYVTSYDVWAKRLSYPQDEGDGVFVGNYTIQPDEDSITEEWTPPNDGTWYFGALAIYNPHAGTVLSTDGRII